jgi:type I restriction enzyme, R subunit
MSILDKHKENVFETEIVGYLASHGWVEGTSQGYDKDLALYPEDLLTYIKSTQPDAYEKMLKREGAKTDDVLLKLLKNLIRKEAFIISDMNSNT